MGLSDSRPTRRPLSSLLIQEQPVGSPTFRAQPSARAVAITPAAGSNTSVNGPIRSGLRLFVESSAPRLHFRGLLGIHSRYGPYGCFPDSLGV